MAEALCGPSNPLQSFQKHASVDRTLQQDKLLPSRSPIQGFRSPPQISPSQVEAEYEAFQRGQPLFPGQVHEPDLPLHAEPSTAPNLQPGWAADFQQLRLHDPRSVPIPSSQFRHEAPMQKSGLGGWHQDFMSHARLASEPSPFRESRTSTASNTYMPRMNAPASYHGLSQWSPIAQGKQPQRSVEPVFDDAAFERAFDAAGRDMLEQETAAKAQQQQQQTKSNYELINEQLATETLNQEATRKQDFSHLFDPEHASLPPSTQQSYLEQLNRTRQRRSQPQAQVSGPNHALQEYQRQLKLLEEQNMKRLTMARAHQDQAQRDLEVSGSRDQQAILEQEEAQRQRRAAAEADELARTAGRLLDNLKDERSEKFQQSNFMQLMRQLRDKEVMVEGESIIPGLGLRDIHPVSQNLWLTPSFRTQTNKPSPSASLTPTAQSDHLHPSSTPETAQPLHPGGRGYPNGSTTPSAPRAEMSGALSSDAEMAQQQIDGTFDFDPLIREHAA